MKPQPSVIELRSYFVTELHFAANSAFDPAKPTSLMSSDLQVESVLEPPVKDRKQWGISLTVRQAVLQDKNVPYEFTIKIWGLFAPTIAIPEERRPQVLLGAGSSVLYGAAREIVRDLTARGPYSPLLLPPVSFAPEAEKAAGE
ncbi:MAG TPA: protein-export chaperone SecB [Edaphobacter sp.]|nr:protein-export chaperone SecB [Edaphobacter sp.]